MFLSIPFGNLIFIVQIILLYSTNIFCSQLILQDNSLSQRTIFSKYEQEQQRQQDQLLKNTQIIRILSNEEGKKEQKYCDSQIMNQLQQQGIQFQLEDMSIILDPQKSDSMQFDLIVSDCKKNKIVIVSQKIKLKMNQFLINNVTLQRDKLFSFQNLSIILIENLLIENTNSDTSDFLELSADEIQINNIINKNSNGYYIQGFNFVKIGQFKVIDSYSVRQDSIAISSDNDIIIKTISLISQQELALLLLGKQLKINKLAFICDKGSISQIKMDSLIINIDTLELGCSTQIYNQAYYLKEYTDQKLYINQITRPTEISNSPSFFILTIDSYYEELNIDQIYINSKEFLVRFQFQKMLKLTLNDIQIDYQLIGNEGQYIEDLILINEVQYVKINLVIINGDNNNDILSTIMSFDQINELQINQINLTNGRFLSNIFNFDNVNKLQISKLLGKDFYFQKTAIQLVNVRKMSFSDFDVTISSQMNWINKEVDQIDDEQDQWKKLYYSDDGSRQFIDMNFQIATSGQLNNISFENVRADFGGFKSRFLNAFSIYLQINFNNIYLQNMRTHQNGGCMRFEKSNKINIFNSSFLNCTSNKFGGAIYSEFIEITNATFSNNKARFGGAISRLGEGNDLEIEFNNNEAEICPNKFPYSPVFFTSNVIQYVQNYNQSNPLIENANKVASDNKYNQNIEIDFYQQWQLTPGIQYIAILDYLFITDDERFIQKYDKIYSGNMYDYITQNNTDKKIIFSKQTISQSIVKNQPYFVFTVVSFDIKPNFILFEYLKDQQGVLKYKLNDCIQGQQKVVITNEQDYFCQYCPYMTANYQNNSSQCKYCEESLFSSCFADYSTLKPGFWRSNHTISSEHIYTCTMNPSACIGGYGYGNELCIEGRIGIQCSSCDLLGNYWGDSYGNKSIYTCVKCSQISNNAIKFIFIFFGFVFVLFLVTQSNSKKISNIVYQQYLSKMNIIYVGNSFRKLGLTSVYIKVLSFNASMIIFIQQQIGFSLKNSLTNMQLQISNPLEVSFASIECLLSQYFPNVQSIGFTKLIFYLLLPAATILLALLFPLIKFLLKKMPKKMLFYLAYLIIIYSLFIILYNTLLSISLDSVICQDFQNGQRQSLLDLTISCESAKEYQVFGIVGLTFYGFFIPFSIIVGLIRNRKRLNKINVLFQFGFLYTEYYNKYFYWEIVRFSVKVLQLILSKVFFSKLELMNNSNILLLILYLVLVIKCQPFSRSFLNKLESISVIIVLINFLGVSILSTQKNQNQQDRSGDYILIGCLLIAFLFTVYLSLLILFSFFEAHILKLQKYRWFSKLFGSWQFYKKYTYSQRTHQNYNKLRNLIRNNIFSQKSINITQISLPTYNQSQPLSHQNIIKMQSIDSVPSLYIPSQQN